MIEYFLSFYKWLKAPIFVEKLHHRCLMGSKCASEQCWKNLALKIENFKLKIDTFREFDFMAIKSPRFVV